MLPPSFDLATEVRRFKSLIAGEKVDLALALLNPEGDQDQIRALRLKSDLAFNRFRLAFAAWDALRRKAGFDPDQPRVPAGNADGGQWTATGGTGNTASPGRQYAQNTPRNPRVPVRINGRLIEATPGQAARLAAAEAEADAAIRRVRDIDPGWRPAPSLHETVEGRISAVEGEAQQARARLAEMARVGIGPGAFAGESIPARGPGRDFTVAERVAIDRIESETGCHTCGTLVPGTNFSNFVCDHQPADRAQRHG